MRTNKLTSLEWRFSLKKIVKTSLFLSLLFGIFTCAFNAKAMDDEEEQSEQPSLARCLKDPFLKELNGQKGRHPQHGSIIGAFLKKQFPPFGEETDFFEEDEKKLFKGYLNSRANENLTFSQEPMEHILWVLSDGRPFQEDLKESFSNTFRKHLCCFISSENDGLRKMEFFLRALQLSFRESVAEAYEASNKALAVTTASQPAFSNPFLRELYEQGKKSF